MRFQKSVIVVLILVAVLGGIYIFGSFSQNPLNTASVIDNPDENSAEAGSQENVIEITTSGFSPKELTIKVGETVTWVNKDTEEHWPASAIHPTHTVYPGSGIDKCDTSEELTIFDACRGILLGESWSFTFNEVGSWNYHDHLNVGLFGKIIVE